MAFESLDKAAAVAPKDVALMWLGNEHNVSTQKAVLYCTKILHPGELRASTSNLTSIV